MLLYATPAPAWLGWQRAPAGIIRSCTGEHDLERLGWSGECLVRYVIEDYALELGRLQEDPVVSRAFSILRGVADSSGGEVAFAPYTTPYGNVYCSGGGLDLHSHGPGRFHKHTGGLSHPAARREDIKGRHTITWATVSPRRPRAAWHSQLAAAMAAALPPSTSLPASSGSLTILAWGSTPTPQQTAMLQRWAS